MEKPYKTKAQTKKGSWDHAWPRKRSLNIEQMIKRMQKDESYLFEMASHFLYLFSDLPWKIGDENGSLLIAWIAAQMSNRHLAKKKYRRR